ncbi:MAG: DUF3035 domain-containing protein [Hyphomonadaceae bacterium]|jgi:hypothetical protein|nr:DUF3035 domain-containing protein [Hyphomonadaceae bacterium]
MNKTMTLVALAAAAAATSACGTISQVTGSARQSPDEFRVVTQAPLTLPPDYSLRPPRPGEARPYEREPGAEARAALFGDNVGVDASAGERAFVTAAGAQTADDEIRETIDYETQNVVRRDQGFVDRVLAFGGSGDQAAPLNPEEEERRLAEDEAIRRATGGGEVTIERDRGGFKLPGT